MKDLPPIFVVSLARLKNRRADITARLQKAGVAFELVDAIDGETFDFSAVEHRINRQKFKKLYSDQAMKKGSLANFLTQYQIWQRIADEKIPAALILEDDAQWQADFWQVAREVITSKYHWNVVHLSALGTAPIYSVLHPVGKQRKLVRLKQPRGCTAAYLIDIDGANKLLKHCHEIYAPVDVQWNSHWQCNLYHYYVQPPPVTGAAAAESSIGDRTWKNKHQLRTEMGRFTYWRHANKKRYARLLWHCTHPPKKRNISLTTPPQRRGANQLMPSRKLSHRLAAHAMRVLPPYSRLLPDKWVIQHKFRHHHGYELDLRNPRTYNEKIQWLKLHDRNPLLTTCTDKFAVREYITQKIGNEILNDVYAVYHHPREIHFPSLPPAYVLKVNHGSGQNVIITPDTPLNENHIRRKLNRWLNPRRNHYWRSREWSYKHIPPCIIAERYLESPDGDLKDYKIHCFNGTPHFIQIDLARFTDHRQTLYTPDWRNCKFTSSVATLYTDEIPKPKCLPQMLQIARVLSADFINVRVDFYVVNHRLIFGEMTFYHESGCAKFSPPEWDRKLGDLIQLPKR